MMTATITENAKNLNVNHRKENHFREEFALFILTPDSNVQSAATLRIYGTDSRAYACAWIYTNSGSINSGSAQAGGYGYHRASAAAGMALQNAGVTLSDDIDGRGNSAIEEALKAIGYALRPDALGVFVHHAHA